MKDYDYLHEIEVVTFQLSSPRPVRELLRLFTSQGFDLHDDVFSLDRKDRVLPWQHSSIAEVAIECGGREVFEFQDGVWDCLKLKYLFATLPFECVESFVQVVVAASRALGIIPEFRGRPTNTIELRNEFERMKAELIAEVGDEPGSESVAIFIRTTYPRNSTSSG